MKKISLLLTLFLTAQLSYALNTAELIKQASSAPSLRADIAAQIAEQRLQLPNIVCEMCMVSGNPAPYTDCQENTGAAGYAWEVKPREFCLASKFYAEEIIILEKAFAELAKLNVPFHSTALDKDVMLNEETMRQTFIVNHSHPATKAFLGFGPEDDPTYNWKDSDYYPAGSIRTNIAEKGFEMFKSYVNEEYGADSPAQRGMQKMLAMVFFHETIHGWQMKNRPVFDFKRYDLASLNADIAARKIKPEMVEGTRELMKYELEAVTWTDYFLSSDIPGFEALKTSFAALYEEFTGTKENPGKYPLLNRTTYEKYMVGFLNNAYAFLKDQKEGKTGAGFRGMNRHTYVSQTLPLEALQKMIEINNSGKKTARTNKAVARLYHLTNEIGNPEYMPETKDDNDVKAITTIENPGMARGLLEIKAAAQKEFERYGMDKILKTLEDNPEIQKEEALFSIYPKINKELGLQ